MKPVYVMVHASGSPIFPHKSCIYPFDLFEHLALTAAHMEPDAITKIPPVTDITVHFDTGSSMQCQLHLANGACWNFQDFIGTIWADLLNPGNADCLSDLLPLVQEIAFTRH
jgi:hypothetical protein